MKLYGGNDLHSTNNYNVLIDEKGKVVYSKRLPNDLPTILAELGQFKNIESIVVESTYNWYWLVDGLMEAGYKVRLANPNAIQQYDGVKYTDDKTDAHWVAELNRLNILAEGYIFPKDTRAIRDLLRKRGYLVKQSTMNILSLQSMVARHVNKKLTANTIRKMEAEDLKTLLTDENTALSGQSNLLLIHTLSRQISEIEKAVVKQIKIHSAYEKLKTIPGIGVILALTIMLETGNIKRFKQVGNYASYCRCVHSERKSNGKKKGTNNKKNGNRYLCWAFVEAANFAIRYNKKIKAYYQRKTSKTNNIVAIKTIAHKLARAAYYVIRDDVVFNLDKLFA